MTLRILRSLRLLLALALIGILPVAAQAATAPCAILSQVPCPGAPCCAQDADTHTTGCGLQGCLAAPAVIPSASPTPVLVLLRPALRPAWVFTLRTFTPPPALPPPRSARALI